MTLIRAVLAALLLASLAFAQQTPAGTEAGTQIQNQATADYIDSGGVARSVDSNLVITTVQQVYDLSITPNGTPTVPGQTKDATPDSTVYFPYTLTNNGNGADDFVLTSTVDTTGANAITPADITFYIDSDGDGVQDTNEPAVTTVTDLGAGESVKLIMAYQIPSAASAGDTATVTPVGTTESDTPNDATDDQTDNDNYNQTTVVQDAAITASKSVRRVVNPGSSETFASGDTASVGDTLEYAITARNTGSAAAQSVEISDVLPTGVTYVTGSASTEPTGNVTNPSSPTGTSGTIEATFATVASGQTVELTFRVTVDAGTESDDLDNVATIDFNDSNGTDRPDVTTNTTTTTVQDTAGVVLGPKDFDDPLASPDPDYETAEDYNVTVGTDVQTVTTADAGTSVSFINTVTNNGSSTDTFNLENTLTDLPGAASTVEFFTLNGTRLLDTNGDNIPDTGPLAADASYSFITRVTIPANKPADTTAVDLSVEVAATSVTNSDITDTTTNVIQDIGGAGVSFGNADDTDGSVDPDPDPRTVAPGDTVVFPMDIVNNGSTSDTFNLTGSVPFTGGDVAVVYYPASADTDGDGTLSPAEIAAASPISNTGPIAAGQETTVFAVVNVPEDAAPQADAVVNQTVTSPTSGATATTTTTPPTAPANTITVETDTTFSFTPNRTGNVTSPGTVIYEHTLVNNGNADITEVSFTDTQSGLGADNFTYTYAFDTDGDGESDDETFYPVDSSSLTLPADITPGSSQQLFVKVNAPSGVTTGAENTLTITAEATFTSGTAPNTTTSTATQSVTDTTIVVGGELSLTKSADVSEAAPGENITYTVTARNLGTDDLTAVVISDPLPAFTDFVSVEVEVDGFPAPQPTLLYSTDGSTYTEITAGTEYTSASAGFSAPSTGGSIYIGVDRDGDATDTTVDSSDTFPPGATVTITFVVEVQ